MKIATAACPRVEYQPCDSVSRFLGDLSDGQLLDSLKMLCGEGRAVLARLLAHLVEVEERRLHLEAACPSMFRFCVQRLGMSEDEACRRIHAARLARRFPDLLVRIERGDLTLSTMALLRGALTEATYEELVEASAGKTKAEVQELLAKRFPKPDVPAAITTIPVQGQIPTRQTAVPTRGIAPARDAAGGEAVGVAHGAGGAGPQLVPLSETRHKVQFTASGDLREKLERAQDLMRHANADGDLAVVVERAVDLLLEKLEKQRLGKALRPRPSPEGNNAPMEARATRDPASVSCTTPDGTSVSDTTRDAAVSRAMRDAAAVSRATRRAVFERDGERCTFTNADGNRCPATTWLEIDHIVARACCGAGDLGNLRVRCRAHNRLHAEQTFGKEHVERKIHERRDPRRRGSPSESGAFGPACERERESPVSRMQLDGYTVAGNALVNMGFRRADVRRALGALSARHQADVSTPLSVQTILHEALALLT